MAGILQIVRKPASIVTEIRNMILRLPRPPREIAVPPETLAHTLAARESVYVDCSHSMCCRSAKLDIQALTGRLEPGHRSMHQDLVGLFVCSHCKAAGRDRRPVFLHS